MQKVISKPKKELHFIIQSKGGVGKSMLTYLLGQVFRTQSNVLFIDTDHSTQTSSQQLGHLAENKRFFFP